MNVASDQAAAHEAAAFVVRWQIAILLLFSPLFLFPSLRLVPFLIILPALWLLSWYVDGNPLPVTALNAQLALIACMVLVSVYATPDIAFSLGKITGVLLGIGVFFGLVRLLTTSRQVEIALVVFVLAGGALACIGVLGTNWIVKVGVLQSVIAHVPALIRGIPGQAEGFQPNAIAGALVMFIPLQFALARTSTGLRRIAYAVLFLMTAATVVLTQSRGAWLALAATFFFWMVWQSARSRKIAAALAIGGVVLIAVTYRPLTRFVMDHFGINLQSDVSGRLELWSRAIMAIEDFPFTGMGMNTFRRGVMVLYPTFLSSPESDVAHAHNHLLQAGVDLGIPGLIGYVSLWLGAGWLLVRCYRLSRTRTQRWIGSGIAAGLLAYFLFQTTDAIALGAKVGIFFWIALALVVGLHRVISAEEADLAT